MYSLSRGEQKSLSLHRAIAMELRTRPELRAKARLRLAWLREKNPAGSPYYDEWQRLLDAEEELFAVLADESEHACALRQESPFADVIDQRRRAAIFREVALRIDGKRTPAA